MSMIRANEGGTAASLLAVVERHVDTEKKHVPEKPLYPTDISDNMQCFTNFEPRNEPNSDLAGLVISGMSKDSSPGWKLDVFENFIDKVIFTRARERGYLDVKYMLYGNKNDGPLSLIVNFKKDGVALLCQTPGEWGKLPDKFKNFWDINTQIYLTEGVSEEAKASFKFSMETAKKIEYTHRTPDTQDVCVYFNQPIKKGTHVITVVPTDEQRTIISVLLVP